MNNIEQLTESLLNKLMVTKYGNDSTILSNFNRERTLAAQSSIHQWLTDNLNNTVIELEQYKQRVMFLEEMVKKSNFAPMIDNSPKGEELIDVLLDRLKQDNYNVFSNDSITGLADRVEKLLFQECEEK